MKKKRILILLAVVIAAVGCIAYMESRFGTVTVVPTELFAEEIEKEMPDIIFTAEETAMVKTLLETPEMQQAFSSAPDCENGIYTFPVNDAMDLLSAYIPEGHAAALDVFGGRAYISFLSADEASAYYSFDPTLEYLEKTIGVYGKSRSGRQTVKAVYSNVNGEFVKYTEKRLWFEWMKKQ